MTEIIIDCRSVSDIAGFHGALAEALEFPAHYGHNLDALHDCLTDISREIRLRLLYWEAAEAALGPKARGAGRAMLDAAGENPYFNVSFE